MSDLPNLEALSDHGIGPFAGGRQAVVGRSGTGKTALALSIAGLNPGNSRPEARALLPRSIPDLERARTVAIVPTDPTLLFSGIKHSLRGELELAFQLIGLGAGLAESSIRAVAELLQIGDLLSQDVFTLSGGEATRAAIAIAGVKNPRLLLLDEIYGALDWESANLVRAYLDTLSRNGCSVVEFLNYVPAWAEEYGNWHFLLPDGEMLSGRFAEVAEEARSRDPFLFSAPPLEEMPRRRTGASGCQATRLRTRSLSFSYAARKDFSLGPIDIDLNAGEAVAVLGHNGSGKTTLFKCLSLLLPARSGSIHLETAAISERLTVTSVPRTVRRNWARAILYVFQNPDDQLYCRTVRDELLETARHVGNTDSGAVYERIVDLFGLRSTLAGSPHDLPRPVRRLITLGSAFIADAPILLLDEPSAGLDRKQKQCLGIAFTEYLDAGGSAMMISHDLDFVAQHATRVLHMEKGQIVRSECTQ